MICCYNRLSNDFFGDSQYVDHLLQVMWHITSECKLNCKMCFSKAQKGVLGNITCEQIEQTVALLYKLGVQKIDLSGGDPLLFPLLAHVVNECTQHGIVPTITTSGFGENDIINWVISNYHLFSRIILSLDGPPPIHNMLRGHSKAYYHFLNLYEQLRSVGCDQIRINTVVSNNLIPCKEEYCKLITSLKPSELCCIQPHPINKSDSFDEYASSESDYSIFVEFVKQNIPHDIKMLQRSRHDFAAYWTLYPNNYLCHLSEENRFEQQFLLLPENVPDILSAVKCNPQTYIQKIENVT